jgi:hypothetical protein
MDSSISRRDFLKGSIIVVAGALSTYALAGCASNAIASSPAATTSTSGSQKVTLHRGYVAAHGDKAFTQIVVAVGEDGKIVAANVDDYQFIAKDTAGVVGVPNSNGGFSAGIISGYVLMSKTENDAVYSAMMAKGGATQNWLKSMSAIEAFAVGKKPSELTAVSGTDAVSGATLSSTVDYLAGIAQVAGDATLVTTGTYTGASSALKLGRVTAAAHGDKAFASAVTLIQDSTIVATSIDEFQFMASTTEGLVGVPNSNASFGGYYTSGQVLASKSINSTSYSAQMAAKAGATTPWLTSMQAIEQALAGQKISSVSISGPDAVSGATLTDTAAYAKAAVAAAQNV